MSRKMELKSKCIIGKSLVTRPFLKFVLFLSVFVWERMISRRYHIWVRWVASSEFLHYLEEIHGHSDVIIAVVVIDSSGRFIISSFKLWVGEWGRRIYVYFILFCSFFNFWFKFCENINLSFVLLKYGKTYFFGQLKEKWMEFIHLGINCYGLKGERWRM